MIANETFSPGPVKAMALRARSSDSRLVGRVSLTLFKSGGAEKISYKCTHTSFTTPCLKTSLEVLAAEHDENVWGLKR